MCILFSTNRSTSQSDQAVFTDPSSEISTNLVRAMILARYGYPVFPCQHFDPSSSRKPKTPLVKWKRGATTNPATISEWWTQFPNALVGLPTGHHVGSTGIVVIDQDEKDGKSASQSIAALSLPDNAAVYLPTMSGGRHAYYSYPEGVEHIPSNSNRFADRLGHDSGIDIRGDGGYVIFYDADPFRLINANLTPLPVDYLPKVEPRDREAVKRVPGEGVSRDELLSALDAISPDVCRTDWIKIGTALKSVLGDEGFQVFDDWSAESKKYFEPEMACVWNSLIHGKASAGTIYYFARKNGWQSARAEMMASIRVFAHEEAKRHHGDVAGFRKALEEKIAQRFDFLPQQEISIIAGQTAEYVATRHIPYDEFMQNLSEVGRMRNEVKKARRRERGEIIESEAKPWVALGISRATFYSRKQKQLQVASRYKIAIWQESRAEPTGDRETGADRRRLRSLLLSIISVSPNRQDSSVKHSVKHFTEVEIAAEFDIDVRSVRRWKKDGIPPRQLKKWRREGVEADMLSKWERLTGKSSTFEQPSHVVSLGAQMRLSPLNQLRHNQPNRAVNSCNRLRGQPSRKSGCQHTEINPRLNSHADQPSPRYT